MNQETLPPARRRPASAQSVADAYKSTVGRSPRQPAIVLPQTLSEITGPLLVERAARRAGERSHAPAHGRAARRAHHRARPRARRGRQGRAQRPGRDLAVQCRRPLSPSGRPARRAARSQLLRRRTDARRCRRQLQVHHRQARRLSVGQPPERLAAGAHPLLAVRAGLRHAPDHADVLPQRSAARLRSDLQLGAGRRARSACRRPSTWRRRSRTGRWPTSSTSCCAAATPRRWKTSMAQGSDAVADDRPVLLGHAGQQLSRRPRAAGRCRRAHRARAHPARRRRRHRARRPARDLAGQQPWPLQPSRGPPQPAARCRLRRLRPRLDRHRGLRALRHREARPRAVARQGAACRRRTSTSPSSRAASSTGWRPGSISTAIRRWPRIRC